ncbi:MAG: GNAT family N-acetyltransferase [Bacteroidetes bacterium]|nr:GNAT family N-acetyltransferase [Bacteroidota bacterium]
MLELICKELTNESWKDFEKLFGERGACGGCWCMNWRTTKKNFDNGKGEGNRQTIKSWVELNRTIGIIGYISDEPVAWCSVAPREDFIRLENSRVLKPIDDRPVWSVSCLFINKKYRKQGISVSMLQQAVQFAKKNGAEIVEGYPTVPYNNNIPDAFAWTGIPSAYERAGFKEAARRSQTRPIMRCYITKE